MNTTLQVGDVVQSNQSLNVITVQLDTWESFSPGVKRNRFTNEIRATRDIPRSELVREHTYAPGELIGIVSSEDILSPGNFSICWYEVAATTGTTTLKMANSERNFALELGGKWWTPEEVTVLRSLPTPAPENADILALIDLVRAAENS